MEWRIVILLFGIVIGITIAAITLITWKARRRSRQISHLAQQLGLAYQSDGSAILNSDLTELPLFTLAALSRRATVSNVIKGDIAGASITAFDYAYWTGSVNTQRFDYTQTVACFRLQPNRYPSFALYPTGSLAQKASMNLASGSVGMLATVANALADKDERWKVLGSAIELEREGPIEIDGHPEFSKQFRLIGSDREAIKRLFTATVLESLARDESRRLCIECSGAWLAVYRKNKQIEPENMVNFLTQCAELNRTVGLKTGDPER